MKKRISKRTREQAALICAIAASGCPLTPRTTRTRLCRPRSGQLSLLPVRNGLLCQSVLMTTLAGSLTKYSRTRRKS